MIFDVRSLIYDFCSMHGRIECERNYNPHLIKNGVKKKDRDDGCSKENNYEKARNESRDSMLYYRQAVGFFVSFVVN